MTTIIREKPETRDFRKKILKTLGKEKMSAYDIARAMEKTEDIDWKKLYRRLTETHIRALEAQGKIEFVGEEEGGGSLPRRMWRKK